MYSEIRVSLEDIIIIRKHMVGKIIKGINNRSIWVLII
jgi:hypothetical protein